MESGFGRILRATRQALKLTADLERLLPLLPRAILNRGGGLHFSSLLLQSPAPQLVHDFLEARQTGVKQ